MNARWTDIGLVWLRVLMGLGSAHHGYAKIFGGQMAGFTQAVAGLGFPLPGLFAWMAALSELVGGLCVALGLGTRLAAFFVFCTMSVAVFLHHRADPLPIKELALAYWTVSGALIAMGGGRFTLGCLWKRRCGSC